jgi:hypothetical protein
LLVGLDGRVCYITRNSEIPAFSFQPCPANPLFQPWDKQAFYNQQGTIYKIS